MCRGVGRVLNLGAALQAANSARNSVTWVRQSPHPRQAEFLKLDCFEALFGGAAGGGKSSAILMAQLKYVDVPGYSALCVRRTFAELALPGAIMDRSHQWLQGTKAHWDGMKKRWTFPSGATLSFGYLDTDKDKYRYQGSELQSLGVDELTQFPETSYRYLLSRMRRVDTIPVPLRVRCSSNPGGIGHEWVHKRFIASPSEHRAFVASKLADNPSIDADEYRKSLAELDTITRRQLEDGIWEQDPTGLVYRHTNANVVSELPKGAWTYAIGLDFGIVDHNAITVLGWREHERVVYVVRSYYYPGSPSTLAAEVKRLIAEYDPSKIIGDTGGMGKAFAAEMAERHGIPIEAAHKTDKLGYVRLLNGALERAEVRALKDGASTLLSEWSSLLLSAKGVEIDGQTNHAADSLLYVWKWCKAHHEEPLVEELGFEDRVFAERERGMKKEWWDQ